MPDTFREEKNNSRSEWDVAYIYKAGRKLFVECQYGAKAPPIVLEPGPSTVTCEFLVQGSDNMSLVCKSH